MNLLEKLMFRVDTDGRVSLRVENTSQQMPLISVVQIGLTGVRQSAQLLLQEFAQTCSKAWSLWLYHPLVKVPLYCSEGDPSDDPNVLCVLVSIYDDESVARACIQLEASASAVKLLLLNDSHPTETLVALKDLVDASFVSGSLELLLCPLRWLSFPPGLIGIDFDDFMSVCAGRCVFVHTVAVAALKDVILAQPPYQGLCLSFAPLPLQEVDAVIDSVKPVVPEHVDFIWHDAQWRSDEGTVDVCFAYDSPPSDFPNS